MERNTTNIASHTCNKKRSKNKTEIAFKGKERIASAMCLHSLFKYSILNLLSYALNLCMLSFITLTKTIQFGLSIQTNINSNDVTY